MPVLFLSGDSSVITFSLVNGVDLKFTLGLLIASLATDLSLDRGVRRAICRIVYYVSMVYFGLY